MQQTWSNLIFIHQEVDPQTLMKIIPSPLELDLMDGKAYISFVPFKMKDIKVLNLPLLPYFSSILEFNLRTYVKYKGQKSVYFFSLDANKSLHIEVARLFFKLNYLKADIDYQPNESIQCIRLDDRDHQVRFNAKFNIDHNSEDISDLSKWLTERYSYLESKSGKVFQGKLEHPPWKLKKVNLESIEENYLGKYKIKAISNTYLCHFAKELKVQIKSFAAI
ncbi:MAG: DUF2071 domain-containing protein [Candidatus Caenarcaniphilales bacterium]|nr:DUF2071 domain-containing protein [Candidatus Caenarcaniphilales bacterium]